MNTISDRPSGTCSTTCVHADHDAARPEPLLRIERATLSGSRATLVRKGFVHPDSRRGGSASAAPEHHRRGPEALDELPDPIARRSAIAFAGADEDDLAITRMQNAVRRLEDHLAAQSAAGRGR